MEILSPLASSLNAICTFCISLALLSASAQRVFPFFLVEGMCLCDRTGHVNAKLVHLFQELHTLVLVWCMHGWVILFLNGVISPSKWTVIGLGDSFFVFLLENKLFEVKM